MDKNYDFDAEVALEKREMLKGLHPQMKAWYHSAPASALREKLGSFPGFWQDLEAWPHFAVAKKMYFIISERYGASSSSSSSSSSQYDVMAVHKEVEKMLSPAVLDDQEGEGKGQEQEVSGTDSINSSSASSATSEPVPAPAASDSVTPAPPPPPKKKNRWGAPQPVDEAEIEAAAAAAAAAGNTAASSGSTTAGMKRNRWGAPADESASACNGTAAPAPDGAEAAGAVAARKKASRWSSSAGATDASQVSAAGCANAVLPSSGMASLSPEALQQSYVLQVQVQKLTERLANLPQEAKEHDALPVSDRPPSPPPIYNAAGVKVNTYEVRMRESLGSQRNKLIEEMLKVNPYLPPPPDYVKQKPQRKLLIPVDEYPEYNFIGLIIGPRGLTQKRLEQQTGCRISIRGKGSMGRGGKSSANVLTSSKSNSNNDENEPLHVYISGETEESVVACVKVVEEILRPVEDDLNEHKQKQLKELALINGTLQVEDFCSICGMKGHRQYECPSRGRSFKAANVKCALCGDMSHPTRDCPLRENAAMTGIGGGASGSGTAADTASALDSEYLNFMAELDGKKPPTPSLTSTAAAGSGSAGRTSNGSSPSLGSSGSSSRGSVILTSTLFTKKGTPPVAGGAGPAVGSAASGSQQAPVIINAKLITGMEAAPVSATANLAQKSPGLSPANGAIPALPPPAGGMPAHAGYGVPAPSSLGAAGSNAYPSTEAPLPLPLPQPGGAPPPPAAPPAHYGGYDPYGHGEGHGYNNMMAMQQQQQYAQYYQQQQYVQQQQQQYAQHGGQYDYGAYHHHHQEPQPQPQHYGGVYPAAQPQPPYQQYGQYPPPPPPPPM